MAAVVHSPTHTILLSETKHVARRALFPLWLFCRQVERKGHVYLAGIKRVAAVFNPLSKISFSKQNVAVLSKN